MTGRRLALLIAVSQFEEDPGLRPLVSPIQDIEALAGILGDSAIGRFQVRPVVENLRANEIYKRIEVFFGEAKRSDTLLLYYSGHGFRDDSGRLYFAATDTRRKQPHGSAISSVSLDEIMGDCRARQKILLLDCCYSGAFVKDRFGKGDEALHIQEYFDGHGLWILMSSSAVQMSFEGNEVEGGPHLSIFTKHLVQGLKTGEADLGGDGKVSFAELCEYVEKHVASDVTGQQPQKHISGRGDIVISFKGREPQHIEEISVGFPSQVEVDFEVLHPRYLKGVLRHWGRLSLTTVAEKPALRSVNLERVYVPLYVGLLINLEIRNQKLVDWWVSDEEKASRSMGESASSTAAERREKRIPVLRLESADLQPLIEHIERVIDENLHRGNSLPDGVYPWFLDAEQTMALQSRLVVTGAPGSGKSTLLRYVALRLASGQIGEEPSPAKPSMARLSRLPFWPLLPFTPILIELRDLVTKQFGSLDERVSVGHFNAYLQDQLSELDATGLNLVYYYPYLLEQLEDSRAMILLDGLDEVPDAVHAKRREQIMDLVHALETQYAGCPITITSRPHAYAAGDWVLPGFGHATLANLPLARVQELARNLFEVVLEGSGLVEEETTAFLTSLQRVQNEVQAEPTFWSSPLLFTLMVALWLKRPDVDPDERLPVTRGGLYREAVTLMLERWTEKHREGKKTVAEFLKVTPEQLRDTLETIAYTRHDSCEAGRTASFTLGQLLDTFVEIEPNAVIDPYSAGNYLSQRAGIIVEYSPHQYRFAHLSFQEHLAACYLARPHEFPQTVVDSVLNSPERWRDVVDLLAAELEHWGRRMDLFELVNAFLDADKPQEPNHNRWWAVMLAGKIVQDYELLGVKLGAYQRHTFENLTEWMAALVGAGALPPVERAQIGRLLARLGDPRSGVALDEKGLPDIIWDEIPAGPFISGVTSEQLAFLRSDCLDAESEWIERESVQRESALATFFISRYPITNAQFQVFIDDPEGYENTRWWTRAGVSWCHYHSGPKDFGFPYSLSNHPRVGISWYEAHAFTQWLGHNLDLSISLPTEPQWEKAARGADGRLYPFGNEFDERKCNMAQTGIGMTCAVGLFPTGVSPYGVYEMVGNAAEWCLSRWADAADSNIDDPEDHYARIERGGAYVIPDPRFLRCAFRLPRRPGSQVRYRGFRVVRVIG